MGAYEYLNTNGALGDPDPPPAGAPGPDPSGTAYIAFAYDALGRRIERTVDSGGASVEVTRYYYDGQNVVLETDADEAPRRSYVHGSQYIDERVLMRLPSGTEYYYLPRELYSVAALTDETGTIVEAATYDTYGQVAVYDGSAQAVEESPVDNPYYFTGRRLDLLPLAGGLKQAYHYRARAYDPRNGRFMQRDPLAYIDGASLYAYVRSSPINLSDAAGLQPDPGWATGIGTDRLPPPWGTKGVSPTTPPPPPITWPGTSTPIIPVLSLKNCDDSCHFERWQQPGNPYHHIITWWGGTVQFTGTSGSPRFFGEGGKWSVYNEFTSVKRGKKTRAWVLCRKKTGQLWQGSATSTCCKNATCAAIASCLKAHRPSCGYAVYTTNCRYELNVAMARCCLAWGPEMHLGGFRSGEPGIPDYAYPPWDIFAQVRYGIGAGSPNTGEALEYRR